MRISSRSDSFLRVEISLMDVREFAAKWPCFGPCRALWAEFDVRGGKCDLIDYGPHTAAAEKAFVAMDQTGLSALLEDAGKFAARESKSGPDELPPSHLEMIAAAGFTVLSYQAISIEVQTSDGECRREWLPRHFVNWQTHAFVEFRKAGDGHYSFDGWEPSIERDNGGRYHTIAQALSWFKWLENVSHTEFSR